MRLTADEALSLSQTLSKEVADRAAARAAVPYDASSYTWQSDDKVGNTLSEIQDIRSHGYPLHHGVAESIGHIRYRGYQYEGTDGFLKGSKPYVSRNEVPGNVEDPFSYLYLLPIEEQEAVLRDIGKEECVHKTKGRGYILQSSEAGLEVYFLTLPGETPTVPHGANIKWVKRENLL